MHKLLIVVACLAFVLAPCLVGGCDAPAKDRGERRCRDCGKRLGALPSPGVVKGVDSGR